jgi:hypothetical protein
MTALDLSFITGERSVRIANALVKTMTSKIVKKL